MVTAVERTALRQQMGFIKQAIRQVERRLAPPDYRESCDQFGEYYFPLPGPQEPRYKGTPIDELIEHLDKLPIPPNRHFVDLGSGLGSACFAAATRFEKVIGIEENPMLLAEAEKIRAAFGIAHVEFRQGDFLGIPLQDFGVVYFFRPFIKDFLMKIRNKLLETRPGTVIISYQFMGPSYTTRTILTFWHPLPAGGRPASIITFSPTRIFTLLSGNDIINSQTIFGYRAY